MKIFDIVEGKVVINPHELAIPAFKELYETDKSKDKHNALDAIRYIVFMYKWDSPYASYTDELERSKVLKKEIYKDERYTLDTLTEKAIEAFRRFQYTFTLQFLEANLHGAKKLMESYYNIDWEAEDRSGKSKYSSKDVASNIEKAGGIIKSLYALQEQVKREQLDKSVSRGGSEINYFEIPKR